MGSTSVESAIHINDFLKSFKSNLIFELIAQFRMTKQFNRSKLTRTGNVLDLLRTPLFLISVGLTFRE